MDEVRNEAGQPSDETPLRLPDSGIYVPDIEGILNRAAERLDATDSGLQTEILGAIADANQRLDAIQTDFDLAVADIVGGAFGVIDKVDTSFKRAFSQIRNGADNQLNDTIDDLIAVGVNPPLSTTQRIADLVQGNAETYQQYFPPTAFDAGFQPDPGIQDVGIVGQPGPAVDVVPEDDIPPRPADFKCYRDPIDGHANPNYVFTQGSWLPVVGLDGLEEMPCDDIVPPSPPPPASPPPCKVPNEDDIIRILGYTPTTKIRFVDATGEYCSADYDPGTGQVQSPQVVVPPTVPISPQIYDPFPVSPPGQECCPPQQIIVPAPVVNVAVAPAVPPVPKPPEPPPAPKPPEPPKPQGPPEPAVPPAPKPATSHIPKSINSIDWTRKEVCADAEELCQKLSIAEEWAKRTQPSGEPAKKKEESWWDYLVSAVDVVANPIGTVIELIAGSTKEQAALSVASIWRGLAAFAGEILNRLTPIGVHNLPAAASFASKLGAAGFVEKWAGIPLTYWFTSDLYAARFCDPQFIPSQAEADLCNLRNIWDDQKWECITKANGNIPLYYADVRDSKASRLDVGQVIDLYRRTPNLNKDFLTARLKELGFREDRYTDELLTVTSQTMQYSDIIRCMVRDAFDDNVVAKYEYGKDFDKKYTKQAKQFGDAIGLPEDVAYRIWCAHWQIPSDSQLFEMIHRGRKDSPSWTADEVTIPMVKEALEINDNAPAWIDRKIALSYHPITVTDGVRAYYIGEFTAERLKHVYLDNGYNTKDTDTIVKFQATVKNRQLANATGVWTTRKTIKAYKEGLIQANEAMDLLAPIIPDVETRVDLINKSDREVRVETMRKCVTSLKRRYMLGEFDSNILGIRLQVLGMDPHRIPDVIEAWTCERDNRRKEPRVTMLCQWFANGIITGDEYYTRLIRLGYSPDDAYRIASVCLSNELAKRYKEAAKQAEKRVKEFKAEVKESEQRFKLWKQEQIDEWERLKKAVAEEQERLAKFIELNQGAMQLPAKNGQHAAQP